jgi:hypothetical protein
MGEEKEMPTVAVMCGSCGRSFDTTDELMDKCIAKCPFCGTKYAPPAEFDWDRFQHLCMLNPSDIPVQVRGALWDLRESVVAMRELVDEPVDMMMRLFAEIHRLRLRDERWANSWDAMEQHVAATVYPETSKGQAVLVTRLLDRMKELKERMNDE